MGANSGKSRKTVRHEDATRRGLQRSTLFADAQIQALDDRLGKGVGAAKERARLSKAIGQQITDEINADPEMVAKLRKSREDARAGKSKKWDGT